MALSVGDREYIRAMSGDDCEEYDVSDTFMDTLYTKSDSDVDKTIVAVLRVRVAKAAALVSRGGEVENVSLSHKFDHLKQLLAQWEARTGMVSGSMAAGAMDLNLGEESDTSEYG